MAGVDARRATPPDPRPPRWGLAGYCQLDPSHPALVTRGLLMLNHAHYWILNKSVPMPAIHVALLRGINVGGKNKLPMKVLAEIFSRAGCSNVQTYIQSGNVVFTAPSADSARLGGLITAEIAKRFEIRVPVVLRTVEEMSQAVSNNPFLKKGVSENELHVLFLADLPDPGSVALLDPNRSPPDTFEVRGREVYLRLPNGVANSKLTNNYFDSKLATTSTGRNWRTITKLVELMAG